MTHTREINFISCLLLGAFLLINSSLHAQQGQGEFLPQERLYIQTDKPYYAAGETIWWQCHLVDGETLQQAKVSNLLTIELYNQSDSLVMRKRIKRGAKGFAGGYEISAKIAPGNYYLRAYTHWMEQMGAAWFPTRNIAITNPVDPRFSQNPLGQLDPEKADKVALLLEKELTGRTLKKAQNNRAETKKNQQDFDCTFFPEGGDLIDGLTQKVAFRVQGANGMPIASTGAILDKNNDTIQEFRTLHDGMGLFMIESNRKAHYTLRITTKNAITKEYKLPKTKENGAALSLNVTPTIAQYRVALSKNLNLQDSLFIVLRQRGHLLYETYLPKDHMNGIIPLKILGEGVVQCLLVAGKERIPLSSRMLFVRHEPVVHGFLQHTIQQAGNPVNQVNRREKIVTTITLKTPIQALNTTGKYAISITDDGLITPDTLGANIRSSLLLCDELKGTIYRPNYYFEDSSRKRVIQADLLMLTHGWRSYGNYAFEPSEEAKRLANLLKNQKEDRKRVSPYETKKEKRARLSRQKNRTREIQSLQDEVYKNQRKQKKRLEANYFERGQSISGRVTNIFGGSVQGAKIAAFNPKTKWTGIALADEDGFFTLDDMLYKDTTYFMLQARTKRGNSHVQLKVEDQVFPAPLNTAAYKTLIPIAHQATFVNEMRRKYFEDGGMQVIALDEVFVEGHKKDVEEETKSVYLTGGGDLYSGKQAAEEGCTNAYDMVSRMAGVSASDNGISIKGEAQVSLIIDDTPYQIGTSTDVMETTDTDGGTDVVIEQDNGGQELVSVLRSIDVSSVRFLGILDAIEAASVGSTKGQPAIVIETEDGFIPANVKTPLGLATVKRLGISDFPTFYSPKYDTADQYKVRKTDIRSTLYWNPSVTIDSTGVAQVTWYTADKKSHYRLTLEGVTTQGIPVVLEQTIQN